MFDSLKAFFNKKPVVENKVIKNEPENKEARVSAHSSSDDVRAALGESAPARRNEFAGGGETDLQARIRRARQALEGDKAASSFASQGQNSVGHYETQNSNGSLEAANVRSTEQYLGNLLQEQAEKDRDAVDQSYRIRKQVDDEMAIDAAMRDAHPGSTAQERHDIRLEQTKAVEARRFNQIFPEDGERARKEAYALEEGNRRMPESLRKALKDYGAKNSIEEYVRLRAIAHKELERDGKVISDDLVTLGAGELALEAGILGTQGSIGGGVAKWDAAIDEVRARLEGGVFNGKAVESAIKPEAERIHNAISERLLWGIEGGKVNFLKSFEEIAKQIAEKNPDAQFSLPSLRNELNRAIPALARDAVIDFPRDSQHRDTFELACDKFGSAVFDLATRSGVNLHEFVI